jgi:SAM-dependent methyltransferase
MSRDPLWQQIFGSRPWGKYPSEELIRFFAAHFYTRPVRQDVKVFEVGFGTGANLWYAAREGFSVYGLEGAPAGCEIALQRLDAEVSGWRTHGPQLSVGDMCDPLPWPDHSFDALVDCNAVMCVSQEAACRVYAELYRITRPGGRLFVRTSAAGTWGDGSGEACGHGAWRCSEGPFVGTGIVRFATEGDLKQLLGAWQLLSLELVTRTLENRSKYHAEWVLSAVKGDL